MNDLASHYNQLQEKDRLSRGTGLLEKERTREILTQHLPGSNLIILDVGGAAGVYAFWLAESGHRVFLVDVMPAHVEQAKLIDQHSSQKLEKIQLADARDLTDFEEGSVDCVLLLGPLYHLTEQDDRILALKEALRVLKAGGKVFAAGINRFASLYDGIQRGLIDDDYFS